MKYKSFFGNRGIKIVKGKDQYVWDEKGNRYIDMHAGNGAAFLGHQNQYVTNEILAQLNEIHSLSTSFNTDIREKLLGSLEKVKPKGTEYVSLLNSGSEAVDFALKVARKITGRKKFIAFKNSFHGRTFGALSVTWNINYRKPFMPLLEPVEFLNLNDMNDLSKIDKETAAVIIEPIQGEGGVYIADEEFLNALYEQCLKNEVILIFDEIQCGFGRTGYTWAHERSKATADIVIAGKGIGGGFPLSVIFYKEEIANKIEEGDHGSTYGGNPLAMAAIVGAINAFIKGNILEKVRIGERYFNDNLQILNEFREIREIRIYGLMIAIEFRINVSEIIKLLQENFILTLKSGLNIIRCLPPYMINDNDIKEFREKIIKILEKN